MALLRCKPGELAWIKKSDRYPECVGWLVEVLGPDESFWGSIISPTGQCIRHRQTRYGLTETLIPDEWLEPHRPGIGDESTERDTPAPADATADSDVAWG